MGGPGSGRPRTVCFHGDEDRDPSGRCRPCQRARQKRARARRRAAAEAAGTFGERGFTARGGNGMDCQVCGRHLVREHGVTEFCIDLEGPSSGREVGHVPFGILYDPNVRYDDVSRRPTGARFLVSKRG